MAAKTVEIVHGDAVEVLRKYEFIGDKLFTPIHFIMRTRAVVRSAIDMIATKPTVVSYLAYSKSSRVKSS